MNENQDGDKILSAGVYEKAKRKDSSYAKAVIEFVITEGFTLFEISGFKKKFYINYLNNQNVINFGISLEITKTSGIKSLSLGVHLYLKGDRIFSNSLSFTKFSGLSHIFPFSGI